MTMFPPSSPIPNMNPALIGSATCGEDYDHLTTDQLLVLKAIRTYKRPMTYDAAYRRICRKVAISPSGFRSRMAELRRSGLVEEAGKGLSDYGNPAKLFRAVR